MTSQQYKSAAKLQSEIDSLEYEIKVIKEQLDSKNKLIRFGGNFNVSAPVSTHKKNLDMFLLGVISIKETEISALKNQFNEL